MNFLDLTFDVYYILWNIDFRIFIIMPLICKKSSHMRFNKRFKKDGLWIRKDKDGQIKCNFKNGKFHGIYRRINSSGLLTLEFTYFKGKKYGLCKSWYQNGYIFTSEYYYNNELHGLQKLWHNNQIMWSKCKYYKGLKHGLYELWDENGTKLIECNFEFGILNGLYKKWYKNGNQHIVAISDKNMYTMDNEDINNKLYIVKPKYCQKFKSFFSNGNIKFSSYLMNDNYIHIQKWNINGEIILKTQILL